MGNRCTSRDPSSKIQFHYVQMARELSRWQRFSNRTKDKMRLLFPLYFMRTEIEINFVRFHHRLRKPCSRWSGDTLRTHAKWFLWYFSICSPRTDDHHCILSRFLLFCNGSEWLIRDIHYIWTVSGPSLSACQFRFLLLSTHWLIARVQGIWKYTEPSAFVDVFMDKR